jgi:hypothetical protein
MFGRMAVFDFDIGFFSYLINWLRLSSPSVGESSSGCDVSGMPIAG